SASVHTFCGTAGPCTSTTPAFRCPTSVTSSATSTYPPPRSTRAPPPRPNARPSKPSTPTSSPPTWPNGTKTPNCLAGSPASNPTGLCAASGRRRRPYQRQPPGATHKPALLIGFCGFARPGEPAPALRVRRVDGPGVPGLPVRALRRRRGDPLPVEGSGRAGPGRVAGQDGRGRTGIASGEDQDRVLQGQQPARGLPVHRVHVPGVHVPAKRRQGQARGDIHRVLARDQQAGPETAEQDSAVMAAAQAHRKRGGRPGPDDQSGGPGLGVLLRAVLPLSAIPAAPPHQHLPAAVDHAEVPGPVETSRGPHGARLRPAARVLRSLEPGNPGRGQDQNDKSRMTGDCH